MNVTVILNLVWLLIAAASMAMVGWTSWQSHRRSKADQALLNQQAKRLHDKMMEYVEVQIERAKQQGKEPWEP